MSDRPRERARIAEEENRNLRLELITLRAQYDALAMVIALEALYQGGRAPLEWIEEARASVERTRNRTLTEGVKQKTG